jgi:PKD repeat protein
MRYIFTCILLIGFWSLGMAQITRVEYFIDTDPGLGNGTSVNFIPDEDTTRISSTFTVPLTTVENGFHTLYLRTRDAQGRWSITHEHIFFNTELPPADQSLAAAEYFIDQDPGFGKGTPITVPANQKDTPLSFNVDLSSVSLGFHTLYLRVFDKGKSWSPATQHAFYVKPGGGLSNITAFKYNFERTGFRSDTLTYPIPEPAPSVSPEFNADLSQLPGDADYTMNIWAVSSDGLQSLVETKKVKVCNTPPAKAKFDFITMGTQVSFMDSSLNAVSYRWDFGDGTTDTTSNPMHTYAEGGLYDVRLIASNFCNSDTLVRQVSALSLQSMYPTKGGNTGSVTVTILGGGFTDQAAVLLKKNNREIRGSNTFTSENGKIVYSTFNLREEEVGLYDLVVSTDNASNLLRSAFEIEPGKESDLMVNVSGRDAIRVGLAQEYQVSITNLSNTQTLAVPLWIAVPQGTKLAFKTDLLYFPHPQLNYDTIPIFVTTDTLFGKPVPPTDLYYLIVPQINAYASVTYPFDIIVTSNQNFQINAWVFPELIDQGSSDDGGGRLEGNMDIKYRIRNNFTECTPQSIKETLDPFCSKDAQKTGELLASLPCNFDRNELRALENNTQKVDCNIDRYYYQIKLPIILGLSHLAKCVIPGAIGRIHKFLSVIISTTQFSDNFHDCYTTKSTSTSSLPVRTVASIDPNEKVGPKGNTDDNFVQGNAPFNYKIYFENLKTATAPAQEVVVIDTLDKHVLNLSTFQLSSFGFGSDVSWKIPAGLSAYSANVDLRPKKNLIVRVDAKLDTATGVLTWRFLSLDPKTMELTDDPLDGFLPANVTSPEGEGFVSFSVKPKTGLATGSQIKNKSIIYFDANAPIVTNTFLNTIDKASPTSQVGSLAATVQDTVFTINWAGNDQGAGVRSYDVYYSINNQDFRLWQYDVSANEAQFTGKLDSTYRFYSIAKDYAGNTESAKNQAEATVKIVKAPLITGMEEEKGWSFKNYPNPFHDETIIELNLPVPQRISLVVRDLTGKEIARLANDQLYGEGSQKLTFNNALLRPGVYICEMKSEKYHQTIKLLKY